MPALVLWLGRLVGWLFSSIIGDNVLRFTAGKVLLTSLFLVVLPLVLNNFIYDLMNMAMSLVSDNTASMGGGDFTGNMSFSGLAAHFLIKLKAPECMSVIVSAVSVRFSLSLIPFVRA